MPYPTRDCPDCGSSSTIGVTPYNCRCRDCNHSFAPVEPATHQEAPHQAVDLLALLASASQEFEEHCGGVSHLARLETGLSEKWWHFGLVSSLVRSGFDYVPGGYGDKGSTITSEQPFHWSELGKGRAPGTGKSTKVDLLLRQGRQQPWKFLELKQGGVTASGEFQNLKPLRRDMVALALLFNEENLHRFKRYARPNIDEAWVVALVYGKTLPSSPATCFGKLGGRVAIEHLDLGTTAGVQAVLAGIRVVPTDASLKIE